MQKEKEIALISSTTVIVIVKGDSVDMFSVIHNNKGNALTLTSTTTAHYWRIFLGATLQVYFDDKTLQKTKARSLMCLENVAM